jgi:hypothetical protein
LVKKWQARISHVERKEATTVGEIIAFIKKWEERIISEDLKYSRRMGLETVQILEQ